ncbi:FAD:protein FMN transferase, partial [Patescibacteria group bacterium]|nr:FAD:protein FMN transferase [Patescibacteria group bacterium]
MKETQIIMGMPVTVEIVDKNANALSMALIFNYFKYVDEKFSTYKKESEITKINRGEISKEEFSKEMLEVFELSEKTKKETNSYFDIKRPDGSYDPSGLVKGWAIWNTTKILKENG